MEHQKEEAEMATAETARTGSAEELVTLDPEKGRGQEAKAGGGGLRVETGVAAEGVGILLPGAEIAAHTQEGIVGIERWRVITILGDLTIPDATAGAPTGGLEAAVRVENALSLGISILDIALEASRLLQKGSPAMTSLGERGSTKLDTWRSPPKNFFPN